MLASVYIIIYMNSNGFSFSELNGLVLALLLFRFRLVSYHNNLSIGVLCYGKHLL